MQDFRLHRNVQQHGQLRHRRQPGRQQPPTRPRPKSSRRSGVGKIAQSISFTPPTSGSGAGRRPCRPLAAGQATPWSSPGPHQRSWGMQRVRHQRHDGELRRGGQLRHRRQPGRQQHLRGRAPSPADDQSGQDGPVDLLRSAGIGSGRVGDLVGHGRQVRQPRGLLRGPHQRSGVCSVSGTNGTTVNYAAAGNCVIDANQAGNSTYAAAPQVQQTITVAG